jgi:Zn-dependent protease
VLLELSQLQNKKPGGYGGLIVLIVSIFLFMLAGKQQWSWSYVLIIAPLLFFHELGHYVAMRAFNYRNLRMFFIPFFGAAVPGRNYNVPGWKKVVVSLMVPVPVILLGVILGAIGLLTHNALLLKIATVSLFLNGFNLLPLLPLAGGYNRRLS